MRETGNPPNTQRLRRYLEMLLSVHSPSKKESAAADVVKKVLGELNVSFVEDDTAVQSRSDTGNIIAGGSAAPRVCFCAHLDTIKIYNKNEYEMAEDTVRAKGGGVIGVDDKSGVAVLLETISLMQHGGGVPEDVRFVFTTCEEQGFYGARYLDAQHFMSAYNFVVDSGGLPVGRVVSRGASQYDFEIEAIGTMTHTGNPDGPHALVASAELIGLLTTGRVSDATFVNISDIHCEGNDNTIPGRTVIRGQILSFDDDEAARLLHKMDSVTDGFFSECGLSGGLSYECTAPGFQSTEDIIAHARAAAEAAGLPFETGKTGAGSDAHVFIARGAEALKISSGMMNVHSRDEYVNLSDMAACVRYVMALAQDYSA